MGKQYFRQTRSVYPTMEEVEKNKTNGPRLYGWIRSLPDPVTPEDIRVLNKIQELYDQVSGSVRSTKS
jgi:hypothetical protein